MQTTQFSEAALHLWNLQTEAERAIALATMGERVSPARYILRQQQADAARAAFREALEAANDTPLLDEYLALLRAHHSGTR